MSNIIGKINSAGRIVGTSMNIVGPAGNGIASIVKTGTEGKVDTYTITFTNGQTTSFTVTNGNDGTDGVDGPAGPAGALDSIAMKEFIYLLQSCSFRGVEDGVVCYLNRIYSTNLTKIEVGYTTNSSMIANDIIYTEITELRNECITILTDTAITVYLWVRLTYSDIGTVVFTNDGYNTRYTTIVQPTNEGGLACFTGNTLINTSNGTKAIADINIGDEVLTTDGIQKVTKKYEHITNKIYNITIDDEVIQSSFSHPFITARGIIQAKNLIVGDVVYDIYGQRLVISNIIIENIDTVVYEINTNTNNYYITNKKILVESEAIIV